MCMRSNNKCVVFWESLIVFFLTERIGEEDNAENEREIASEQSTL